jgi:L-asparaginase II
MAAVVIQAARSGLGIFNLIETKVRIQMDNPVLVEVLRGAVVESRHRGAVSVVDGDGKPVLTIGDVERPMFPRSAIKAMQAMPLVESGAADDLMFGNKELALACASHNGEEGHVETARTMLARAGITEDAFECGAHWPFDQPILIDFVEHGHKPLAVHNNCSGKHAGFLCFACHEGIDTNGYVALGHKVQDAVRDAMESITGAAHSVDMCGTDGCSIPTYAIPLDKMAHGFAKMATGNGLGPERAKAARRLIEACMAEPWHTAGTGRACTQIMQAAPGRVFAKVGAEGVYAAAIPELGLGIALKCDDGSERGAVAMVNSVLARLFGKDEASELYRTAANKGFRNWNKIEVGKFRPSGPLA